MSKAYFIIICSVLFLGLGVSGCSSGSAAKKEKERPELPVITLRAMDTVLQKPYVADIQAVRNVEIRARVKGFLEQVYVDEGMMVKKGQKLFRINDEEYRIAVVRAKAALTSAIAEVKAVQLEKERVRMLVKKNVISDSELEVTEAKLQAINSKIVEAKTALSNASRRLSYTTVEAPFDGYIDRIPLKTGSLIDEGVLLTGISDVSSMFAYFEFPETEYLQYVRLKKEASARSSTVKLVLADGSSYAYPGKIETVEGEIEQSTGSIAFRARFPNPDKLLRHGATGRLFIASKIRGAVMVPQKSVFEIQDKNYVYLVDKNNTLHMKSFTPGTRFSQYYLVKEGLKADDKILFEGAQNVRDGMAIIPEPVKTDSLMAKNLK